MLAYLSQCSRCVAAADGVRNKNARLRLFRNRAAQLILQNYFGGAVGLPLGGVVGLVEGLLEEPLGLFLSFLSFLFVEPFVPFGSLLFPDFDGSVGD